MANANWGDSFAKCREQIRLRELTAEKAHELLNSYPFDDTHLFLKLPLKEKRLVVWSDDKVDHRGWPLYIFGSFSPEGKLIDLIGTRYSDTSPLVPGIYAKRVASIAKGMSVTKMYELIGKQNPEYFRSKNGKWIVRFTYNGYPGQFYIIEADARTGIITSAYNGTI